MSRKISGKKAQITIFIILGIVLLFSTALILFIRAQITEVKPLPPPTLEKIPSELEPIRTFVSSCIEQTAVDGLIKIGHQGGYVDTRGLSYNKAAPTEGEAIAVPGTNIKVPYWWHMSSSNECTSCRFRSEKPSISDVQKNLAKYIADNLQYCVGGFAEFVQQGFAITPLDQINPRVSFERETTITVDWPLDVKKAGSAAKIQTYFTSIPINFKRIYDLANSIANAQANNTFLEKQTLHVIAAFGSIDKDKLPPMSAVEFAPVNSVQWIKSKVKDQVVSLVQTYTPLLQIYHSYNFIPRAYSQPIKQGLYDTSILPIGADILKPSSPFQNISANFYYLDLWPVYFDITGRGASGELLGPESASSSFLPWLGMKRYDFYYQLSFPTLVELRDTTSLKGRGYSFEFALESNIRNNEPLQANLTETLYSPELGSLLCNENQKQSGNVTVHTNDARTGAAVDEVQLSYACGDEACAVGFTELAGRDALLTSKLPICAGGAIVSAKDGYRTAPTFYDAEIGKNDNLTISLEPIRDKNITIKKKKVIKTGEKKSSSGCKAPAESIWTFTDTAWNLDDEESVVLSLEKIKESPAEEDFTQTMVFEGNQSYQSIQLVPGRYKFNAQLLLNRQVIIPEDEMCYPDPDKWWQGLTGECGKCTKIAAVDFNETFLDGGVVIDDRAGYWTLDAATLDQPRAIVFYIVAAPDDFTLSTTGVSNLHHSDLEQIGKVDDYSQTYWQNLLPRPE